MSGGTWECYVAVVDDEEPVRRALGRLVRSFGFEAELFPSGSDFLDSLEKREPHCVVLDLHMPEMDGFETQRRLAAARRLVPVVAITGQDTADARTRARELGAVAYLRKPVDASTLLEAILRVVAHGPDLPGSGRPSALSGAFRHETGE